jgi:hypothetical protein
VPPGEDRALSLEDAVAALDAGEVKPGGLEIPAFPDQPGFRELTPEAIDALADGLFRPPPPPLPDWLEPLAELVAEKLKPVVRAEVRAAMKARRTEASHNVTDQSTLAREAGHVVGGLLAGHRIRPFASVGQKGHRAWKGLRHSTGPHRPILTCSATWSRVDGADGGRQAATHLAAVAGSREQRC